MPDMPPPDEQGFRMWIEGTDLHMQVRRTPQEWQEWCDRAPRVAEELRDRLVEVATETEEILAAHDTFDLLTQMMLPLAIRGEDAHEWDAPFPSAAIEYATMLALKHPYSDATHVAPIAPGEVHRLIDLATEAVYGAISLQALRHVREEGSTPLDDLQMSMFSHEMIVRVPSYVEHEEEMLRATLGACDQVMRAICGLVTEEAISLARAVNDLFNESLTAVLDRAATGRGQLREMLAAMRREGTDLPHLREVLALSVEQQGHWVDAAAITWATYMSGSQFSFDARKIAERTSTGIDVAEAFLEMFSVGFEDVAADFFMPTPTHPLKTRPMIRHGDLHVLANMMGFPWALRPRVEQAIKDEGSERDWQRYQPMRARALERLSVKRIADAVHSEEAWAGLRYPHESGTPDLDGLVMFDRTLFLIECKSGGLRDSARRAAESSLERGTRDLVSRAHEQALRAVDYVKHSSNPFFEAGDGQRVVIDKKRFLRTILVCVTLESVQPITTYLNGVAAAEWIEDRDLPWALCLGDLMTIAELIEFPEQLVHFVQRRLRVQEVGMVRALDEVDYFGNYLASGLFFEDADLAQFDRISLLSHTEPVDRYFGVFGDSGRRMVPRQPLPRGTRSMIDEISAARQRGWSEVVLCLLEWATDAQIELLAGWHEARLMTLKDGKIHNLSVTSPEAGFGLTLASTPRARIVEAIQALHQHARRKRFETGLGTWHCILNVPEWPGLAHVWLSDPDYSSRLGNG